MSHRRRRQLQRTVRWLGREKVALFVGGGAWMMPLRRDFADYTFSAVLNFETDGWETLVLEFEHTAEPGKLVFEILEKSGVFRRIVPVRLERSGSNIIAAFDLVVPALDAVVLFWTHLPNLSL